VRVLRHWCQMSWRPKLRGVPNFAAAPNFAAVQTSRRSQTSRRPGERAACSDRPHLGAAHLDLSRSRGRGFFIAATPAAARCASWPRRAPPDPADPRYLLALGLQPLGRGLGVTLATTSAMPIPQLNTRSISSAPRRRCGPASRIRGTVQPGSSAATQPSAARAAGCRQAAAGDMRRRLQQPARCNASRDRT